MQYVERKVFRITEAIAEYIFKDLPMDAENSAFKFAIMEKMEEGVRLYLEYRGALTKISLFAQ